MVSECPLFYLSQFWGALQTISRTISPLTASYGFFLENKMVPP